MNNSFDERFEKLKELAGSNPTPAVAAQQEVSPQQVHQPLSFVVPTEIVDLPSRGKFYPEGHALKDKDTVEIKQMTAKEEDILTNKSFIKKGIVIDKLIQSLLLDRNLDATSLLVGDKNAIMIAARIGAYGPLYDVVISCEECGTKNSSNIDLSVSQIYDAERIVQETAGDIKYVHARLGNGNILIQLPKTGWYVECRLLTGRDEQRLLSLLENKRRIDSGAEISISEQLVSIIASINGVREVGDIEMAVAAMPAYDAKHLRKAYQKLIPNTRVMHSLVCSACYHKQDVEAPFTQEFFWPSR